MPEPFHVDGHVEPNDGHPCSNQECGGQLVCHTIVSIGSDNEPGRMVLPPPYSPVAVVAGARILSFTCSWLFLFCNFAQIILPFFSWDIGPIVGVYTIATVSG